MLPCNASTSDFQVSTCDLTCNFLDNDFHFDHWLVTWLSTPRVATRDLTLTCVLVTCDLSFDFQCSDSRLYSWLVCERLVTWLLTCHKFNQLTCDFYTPPSVWLVTWLDSWGADLRLLTWQPQNRYRVTCTRTLAVHCWLANWLESRELWLVTWHNKL